jgi:calcium/calmodulin-dependent protein kinase I
LDQRQANSIVSYVTGAHKTIATAATNFKEEGSSGASFNEYYQKGILLGEGAFASVHRCTHKNTGFTYAVKEIDISGRKVKELKTLESEIDVLKFVRGGPSILRLLDVYREQHKFYIILEEMKGGDLLDRILEKDVYTESEARTLCKHFFEAVNYCHRKRIAHRDIKLDNVLLAVSTFGGRNKGF